MKYTKGAKQEPDKRIFSKETIQPKKSFSGFSPNLFIGTFGYPFINVGALSSESKKAIDQPKEFAKNNASFQKVIDHRQQFINSRLSMHVKNAQGRFIEQLQDVAKSTTALDSEIDLVKPLPQTIRFNQQSMPHGPSATLKKLELTANARVKKKVEHLTSDTDVKASVALKELGDAHIDEHQLTKLLSAGTLGQKRKLVPTKWSITAVDDIRSKQLLRDLESAEDIHPHMQEGLFMGNHFFVLFLPGQWSFELLELTSPETIYNTKKEFLISHDFEYLQGRKEYAKETAGGYYASRLPVLEYLTKKQRQGRVIIIRLITPDYTAPVGVWTVREGLRRALAAKEQELDPATVKETIALLLQKLDKRLDPKVIIHYLQLLKEEQKRIKDYKN